MVEVNATGNMTMNVVDTFSEEVHLTFKTALEQTGSQLLHAVANNPWLMFIAIILVGLGFSYLVVFLSKTVVKAFTRRTETDLDDKLLDRLQHPTALMLFILTFSIALVPLSPSSKTALIFNHILISAVIFIIGVMAHRVFAVFVDHYGKQVAAKTDSPIDDHILPIVRKMIAAVIFTIAFLIILTVWGVKIAPLLAGAGIAGIAVAFALQETLKNLFGGVSLAFDGAYGVGDRIKLQDGTVGTVNDISLRSTKIRTFTGDLMVVPNGKIANESFHTYAQPTAQTAVNIPFSIAYGTDIEKVKKIILAELQTIPHRIEDDDHKTSIDFTEMGVYGLQMRAWFWVDDYTNSWAAKLEATNRIYTALVKHKIEIPFPTQTLYVRK
jgi:MscS family membrane protein